MRHIDVLSVWKYEQQAEAHLKQMNTYNLNLILLLKLLYGLENNCTVLIVIYVMLCINA